MKIPQCYFNIGQRKTVKLFISVRLKHARELTYKVFDPCTCCLCTEKWHLAENAYQTETNIKRCNWDNIFLCLRYSHVYKGEYSSEIFLAHVDVMLKSALMQYVNPLMIFLGLYDYSYFTWVSQK